MDTCCGMTRRQLLQLSAVGGSAVVLAPLFGQRALASAADLQKAGVPVAQDLELVTVTDTSFELTWFTGTSLQTTPTDPRPLAAPADAVVRYGTRPDRLDRLAHGPGGTAYHHVVVDGLRPGTTYWYEALSAGRPATPRIVPVLDYAAVADVTDLGQASEAQIEELGRRLLDLDQFTTTSSGTVTTLVPPPGRYLFTVALSNDLHMGEESSGIISDGFPPPFSQAPGEPPYPVVMGRALLRGARAGGADVLIVAGDLTSAATPDQLADARQLLDTWGPLTLDGQVTRGSYVVARGNHDQPKTGDAYASCPVVAGYPSYHDCLPAAFPLPQGTLTVGDHRGLQLIGLDTTTVDTPGGMLGGGQLAELAAVLADDPARPTLVFGHHPVTDASAFTTIAGPTFDLDRPDAAALEALYARTPGVFLHHSGHTHRNKRTASLVCPDVEFLEVAAIKEYPGGYTLLRLYEGGYLASFHKNATPQALEWSQTSSNEYLGLYPAYTLGSLADRNHLVRKDFRTLA